jgi:malate dehydrogenase (oxaloacetate-decarboxylating)
MGRTSRLFDIVRDENGKKVMRVHMSGQVLLRMPIINKGTAFTENERAALGLDGLLPPLVNGLEQQMQRVMLGYHEQPTDLAKYVYLRALQERHELLFYAVLEAHLEEMLPIVYTPTVGDAVKKFHQLYQSPRGVSLSSHNVDRAGACIANYPFEDVRMIVATDSSAILGIGDQGYGGLAISIGKLALYTAGGGVAPYHTMPVLLDVGTEREDLISDKFYLGVRERRLRGDKYLEFLDAFVDAVRMRWPRAVIQWEDLSKDTAFTVLERYRKKTPSFNDDIQGTGAVTLAGVLNACRVRGERMRDQRVVIHGAGAGGVGVAWAIWQGMIKDGASPEDAARNIFVLDSKGLLTKDRPMEAYKLPFAQERARIARWPSASGAPHLLETIEQARATVLLGLSGQAAAFDRPVVEAMAKSTPRPVVFALSNPTSSAEAQPADVIAWTNGAALVATGSPFPPVSHGGTPIPVGQGNNAFIFPGLGFGAILSDAREITDAMVLEASYALAEFTAERHPGAMYPPVSELQEASQRVAMRVYMRAVQDGVSQAPARNARQIEEYVLSRFWRPEYMPVERVG